ncbi:hypothetical protein [Streptomyces sp. NPDC101206]|uniref:hypothetical protein n=1 Tax=Streptomyces sp. NPDC101206 TaxID=3366128 RepID=UPI00382BC541
MAWLIGCRRPHRRYAREAEHFLAFTSIACALIRCRRITTEDDFLGLLPVDAAQPQVVQQVRRVVPADRISRSDCFQFAQEAIAVARGQLPQPVHDAGEVMSRLASSSETRISARAFS